MSPQSLLLSWIQQSNIWLSPALAVALITWDGLKTRSALQSWKWQLIGIS